MRNHLAALSAVLALFAAHPLAAQGGIPAQPEEEQVDRVVAVVGDTTLLYSDVVLALEELRASGETIPTDPAGRDSVVREVVDRRVNDLMLVEGARAAKITVTAADVADMVDRQIAQVQQQFGSEAELIRVLRERGRSLEEYRASLTAQAIDRTMIQRFVVQRTARMPRPTVSEAEQRAFFEARGGQLGQRPANLSFQQAIVLPTPSDSAKARAMRTATEVLEELRKGGDFEVLARRYSADGSREQGGSLGWFREGQMVRPFEAVAFALRPGETSGIVETQFGYHIIRLEKIRGPERQARHILIRPEITPEDMAAARVRADSIANAVRAGASLPQLAATTNTPADQRVSSRVTLERLPPAYAAVLTTAPSGQVVGPFEVQSGAQTGFAVVRITDRQSEGAYELADLREQVIQRIQEGRMEEALIAELRGNTYVALSL
ncbi:MAG TPA: peptidylprolyl isomerase [Longimicrobium sp.]|jgi:peptidyl-prolyl cis-trans isomerase SurA